MRPSGAPGDGNGSGDEHDDRSETGEPPRLVRVSPRPGPARPYPLPAGVSPDQACLGCLIGIGTVVLTALFWGWYFWRLQQNELERQRQVRPIFRSQRPPAEARPRINPTPRP